MKEIQLINEKSKKIKNVIKILAVVIIAFLINKIFDLYLFDNIALNVIYFSFFILFVIIYKMESPRNNNEDYIYVHKKSHISNSIKNEKINKYIFKDRYIRTFHKGLLHNIDCFAVISPYQGSYGKYFINGEEMKKTEFIKKREEYINQQNINNKLGNF
jgi:hypothetical protein